MSKKLIPFFHLSKIEGVKKNDSNKNKQPVKEISHQDIYALYDVWEQFQSWQEVLPALEKFFEEDGNDVMGKSIMRVTQPIVTKEHGEQYLKLLHDSIDNNYSLRFTIYSCGYEHHVPGKCYLIYVNEL
ncbi:hypothetical protein [Listeria monocytogenes]|uniref:hypothetical protein n=1 Tax=Listeria monocytogenes TaxID=1639 RepID=UPI00215A4A9D|nr:hypothetical protein [Listeria monocytogenes]